MSAIFDAVQHHHSMKKLGQRLHISRGVADGLKRINFLRPLLLDAEALDECEHVRLHFWSDTKQCARTPTVLLLIIAVLILPDECYVALREGMQRTRSLTKAQKRETKNGCNLYHYKPERLIRLVALLRCQYQLFDGSPGLQELGVRPACVLSCEQAEQAVVSFMSGFDVEEDLDESGRRSALRQKRVRQKQLIIRVTVEDLLSGGAADCLMTQAVKSIFLEVLDEREAEYPEGTTLNTDAACFEAAHLARGARGAGAVGFDYKWASLYLRVLERKILESCRLWILNKK